MIISKRNHLDKMEMARPLKSIIDDLINCQVSELASKLLKNMTWERPRGDLFHWVPVLNRFDEIFESIIKKHGLEQEHPRLVQLSDSDETLVVACLNFTYLLLDHCANRSIYSSSERIFQLLSAVNVDVRLASLEVAVCIGERYLQTNSSKYSAPKPVRMKVLKLAQSYPPPLPPGYSKKSEDDHISLLDTLTGKPYPRQWKLLHYQYFKSELKDKKDSKKSPKKKPAKASPQEGLAEFALSEENLRKLSLDQIYDKACEQVPQELWFDFAITAQIAKAFNIESWDANKFREKLLRIKCLSIAFLCCMCPSDFTAPRLFEPDPYIFSYLVDFVQPENSSSVTNQVFFAAVKALECISMKRVWGNDIIRCMGGNVNHGILFRVVRHINKKIVLEDDDVFEKGYIHFFNMLGNLIDYKSATPRLTAGGILNDLMLFLNTSSKYRWTCSAAVHLITIYLSATPNALTDFVNNDGFNLLINTINYEVDFALENPNYAGGPPKESVVHYSISFRQANYIRNLMKLVSHLIQSDSGDRLRNLFDSPLLHSFNKVIENPPVFGPLILSATIDAVFYIIHNEPTAFSILNEAKVIDTILDNYGKLILPSSDLLMSLPEVLGAICLNKEGLKKVIDLGAIPTYFTSFSSIENAKELVRADMSTNLGCSFDELGRHYPDLKPTILKQIIALIPKIAIEANNLLEPVKLYTNDEDGEEIRTWEGTKGSYLLDNVFFFLGGLLQDSGQWGSDVIESIDFQFWQQFLTLSNAPFDYTTSNGFSSLMGVLKYFDDEQREYGLPHMLSSIEKLLSTPAIKGFIKSQDTSKSYFDGDIEESSELLRDLNIVNTFLYTLTEIYINQSLMFHERYHQIVDHFQLEYFELLNELLIRCIKEEIIIRSRLPNEIAQQTTPALENEQTVSMVIYKEKPSKQEKQEGTSFTFKNALQIRFFMQKLQSYICTLYSAIGRVCMMKRQEHVKVEWRRYAVELTNEISLSMYSLLTRPVDDSIRLNYQLVATNICSSVLIQKERSRDTVQTSLMLTLLFAGILHKIKGFAVEAWNLVVLHNPQEMTQVKELDYVKHNQASFALNLLTECLNILYRGSNIDSYQKLPSAKLFFHFRYEDVNVDSVLLPLIVGRVQYDACDVLLSTLGNTDHSAHYENLTLSVIKPLVLTLKLVESSSETPDVPLIDLDPDNVFPCEMQVDFLVELGLDVNRAEHLFKHVRDINLLEELSIPICSEIGISEEKLNELIARRNSTRISCIPKIRSHDVSTSLRENRPKLSDGFLSMLMELVTAYPESTEEVANVMRATFSKSSTLKKDLVEYLRRKRENGEDINAKTKLTWLLLKTDGDIDNSNSQFFSTFLTFFLIDLKSALSVENDYMIYGLDLVAHVMSYRSIPEAPEEKPTLYFVKERPDTFSDESMQEILDTLSNLEAESIESANVLVKLMILFAKEQKFTAQVLQSSLFKHLVILCKKFVKNDGKGKTYQANITVLVRLCFETTEVLRTLYSAEINHMFSVRDKKSLNMSFLLNLSVPLICRDSQMYIEAFTNMVRFNNYDGGNISMELLNASLKDVEEKTPEKASPVPSTGIVHMLLSELMEVNKTDWTSDGENLEVKEKDKDVTTLMKNDNFVYACFLIRTLTELVGSYKQAKLEFLTFSKNANHTEPMKPRSSALNFLIHQFIPTHQLEKSGNEYERRNAMSSLAKFAILALASTPTLGNNKSPDPNKEDADMAIIRNFYVDVLVKILKDTVAQPQVANIRYGKLADLFDLCGSSISSKLRELAGPLFSKSATKYDGFFLAKVLIEKQVPQQITNILATADINFPNLHKVSKTGLKVLNYVSKVKVEFLELFQTDGDKDDDEVVEDDMDDDDTPDLFKNSTLGMYDVNSEEEEEDSDEPLDLMMEEMDDGMSEMSSSEDEQIDEMDDLDDMSEVSDGYGSEVEIIDELDFDEYGDEDEEEGDEEDEEDEDEDEGDEEDDEEGEGESVYDEDELDGWIEAFEGESDTEEDEEPESVFRRSDESGVSDDESEVEAVGPTAANRRRDFASTFFEALRPALGQPIALVFGGLFSTANDDYRLLRGSIQIGDRGDVLNFVPGQSRKTDDPVDLYVKSSDERWEQLLSMFFHEVKSTHFYNVVPSILSALRDESIAHSNKKKEEAEAAKREREERQRKLEQERLEREELRRQETTHEPVMVWIGDREVDIGGTDIDPEFFEALPEDMREEVFTQHVRERRANASTSGEDVREIDQDFLDALPDQIRDEILERESMARRYHLFEENDEMDEMDEMDDMDEPEFANRHERESRDQEQAKAKKQKKKKVHFTPLVDKAGVASLVRLLFVPQSSTQRDHIHVCLQTMCQNKQTRIEMMTLLVGILQDGLHSQKAIEKVYSQVCFRAGAKKTFPIAATPLVVGIQIIEAVLYLLDHDVHVRYYLLTEHENTLVRKSKHNLSLSKENKYPINYLLRLLGNKMVNEEQAFIDILARVLHIATRPLQLLRKAPKSKPPFSTPSIPDHNYRQIIKMLTSNDCPNSTFRRAISAMQSLSILPNAQKVFSIELSDQATKLGLSIIHDLNSLTKEIKTMTEYNAEAKPFAKFSASSSDQAKLLRILTALDYMFESKEKENENAVDDEELSETEQTPKLITRRMSIDEIEELTGLYKKLALGSLWDALSDCLRLLEEQPGMSNIATVLLPLIEALMVVCKHSKVKELQIKDVLKYEAKKIDFTKEPIERLFFSFTDEHKKILNHMVRTNPNLMSGPFGMLVRNPRVLEFDNKKNYFDRQLHQKKNENNKLSINIRRDQVFLDSYRALFFKSRDEFRDSKLEINFKGESGIDAGGVTREWYQVLSRQMFNPDYALFTPVASDETTFHPNRTSYINPEHLSFFKFIGRIIGKAIYDGSYLDCHFSRAVYKKILGKHGSLKDMENLDLEYFKSLMWMLENDITDVITEDFSVETDDYGEHKTIDLVENGRNIPVTEANKNEYVKLVVEYRLSTSVIEQMNNFITGFHEIIPKDLVSIFDEQELELLISGLPDINVDDWKNNTTYNNYSPSSIQIQWFWRAVKSFDNEERAKLLQFATGTSKVPLNGFKELSGANGTCKFSIHRDYGLLDRLPSSHTCFNQIDLPAYETYETLRGSLLLAITEGHEGFGLA